jgi:hypothetical protein
LKSAEDVVDENILKIGYHPPATEYDSRKLNDPRLRLKEGYEEQFLSLMEANHQGFDQHNVQYGFDDYVITTPSD